MSNIIHKRPSTTSDKWRHRQRTQRLVFSPLAWLKLMYFLHAGNTEVGGFAISCDKDPLYIQDFVTVSQATTCVGVHFADEAVADYFDRCVDGGLTPERFGRIWCHTHPADSAQPSRMDEETFERVFGRCDWAIMFIVSRTARTYARLCFPAGPGGNVLLEVEVDWAALPMLIQENAVQLSQEMFSWTQEFIQNIHPVKLETGSAAIADDAGDWWEYEDYIPFDHEVSLQSDRFQEEEVRS
jgi:hypothetical protein